MKPFEMYMFSFNYSDYIFNLAEKKNNNKNV